MTFGFVQLTSKTFWLGVAMLVAGIIKLAGIDVPVLGDLILSAYPDMDGGALLSSGLGLIFLREAVAKVGSK